MSGKTKPIQKSSLWADSWKQLRKNHAAIAGLVISLVPPLISAAVPGARLKVAARNLAVGLRDARSQAIRRDTKISVVLKTDPPQFIVDKEAPRNLPQGLDMTVVSGWSTEMDQIPAQTTGNPYKPYVVQFYPDGSATRTEHPVHDCKPREFRKAEFNSANMRQTLSPAPAAGKSHDAAPQPRLPSPARLRQPVTVRR